MRGKIVILQILFILVIIDCNNIHRSRDKEREAVQLLGTAALKWYEAKFTLSKECPRIEIEGILNNWLRPDLEIGRPNLADGLHETAIKLANIEGTCRHIKVWVATYKNPDPKEIVAILGKEEARFDTVINFNQMSTYKYGWLNFIAINDKVAFLDIDFAASGY